MLIRLENSGRAFEAADLEFVLDAAERAGINLPYSCRDGVCGTCKARLSAGRVEHGIYSETALTEAEREQGYFLPCCSIAETDLVVDAPVEEMGFSPAPMNLVCQVRRIERPLDDVAIVSLDLPTGVTFRFRAGQYVEVLLEGGARRSFSIANPPQDAATIELHIRRVPGGRFTERVFSELRAGDALEILGPKGGFYLRKEARPVVLLASGTGFAPIKSMVLFAMRHQLRGPAHLYWGAESARGLYMAELPAAWVRDYPGFHFVPIVSEPQRVYEAVVADFPDLSRHDVYACGVPALVNAARRGLIERCGLPPERFFANTFLTTADRLGTTP